MIFFTISYMACSSSSNFRHRYFRRIRSPHRKAKPGRGQSAVNPARHFPWPGAHWLSRGRWLCWRLRGWRPNCVRPGLASRRRRMGHAGLGETSCSVVIFLPPAVTRAESLVLLPASFPGFHLLPCEPELAIHTYIHARPFVFEMLLPIMMSVPARVGKGAVRTPRRTVICKPALSAESGSFCDTAFRLHRRPKVSAQRQPLMSGDSPLLLSAPGLACFRQASAAPQQVLTLFRE